MLDRDRLGRDGGEEGDRGGDGAGGARYSLTGQAKHVYQSESWRVDMIDSFWKWGDDNTISIYNYNTI